MFRNISEKHFDEVQFDIVDKATCHRLLRMLWQSGLDRENKSARNRFTRKFKNLLNLLNPPP